MLFNFNKIQTDNKYNGTIKRDWINEMYFLLLMRHKMQCFWICVVKINLILLYEVCHCVLLGNAEALFNCDAILTVTFLNQFTVLQTIWSWAIRLHNKLLYTGCSSLKLSVRHLGFFVNGVQMNWLLSMTRTWLEMGDNYDMTAMMEAQGRSPFPPFIFECMFVLVRVVTSQLDYLCLSSPLSTLKSDQAFYCHNFIFYFCFL